MVMESWECTFGSTIRARWLQGDCVSGGFWPHGGPLPSNGNGLEDVFGHRRDTRLGIQRARRIDENSPQDHAHPLPSLRNGHHEGPLEQGRLRSDVYPPSTVRPRGTSSLSNWACRTAPGASRP